MNIDDIHRGFQTVLRRAPDEGAIAFYREKSIPFSQFCEILKKSPEYRQKYVNEKSASHRNSFTAWPLTQLFVAQNIRVVYCPIAKNACSSLKRMMVEISDIPDKLRIARSGDIHSQTDRYNTGIQLKDLDEDEARSALFSSSYFRFVVLRDPGSRLLSAYWEKFVVNRLQPGNLAHTMPVLTHVYQSRRQQADPERGISFREFINYVSEAAPRELDPHWCPQHTYLGGINYNAYYDLSNLTPLLRKLSELTGNPVNVKKHNVTDSGRGGSVINAHEMLPQQLSRINTIGKSSFFNKEINGMIATTFSEDYRLLSQCNA